MIHIKETVALLEQALAVEQTNHAQAKEDSEAALAATRNELEGTLKTLQVTSQLNTSLLTGRLPRHAPSNSRPNGYEGMAIPIDFTAGGI